MSTIVRRTMATLFLALTLPAEAPADPWSGDWIQVDIEGVGGSRECGAVAYSERRVQLNRTPSGGEYEGFWIHTYHYRITYASSPDCRAQGAEHPYLGARIRHWLFNAGLDAESGELRVSGHSGACMKDWCEGWDEKNETFETVFRLVDGLLVDTGATPDPSDDRVFLPVRKYQEKIATVSAVNREVGRYLAKGDCETFYNHTSTDFRSARTRADWLRFCRDVENRSKIKSRSFDETVFATRHVEDAASGPFGTAHNRLQTAAGPAQEYIVFVEEDGRFRVDFYSMGM